MRDIISGVVLIAIGFAFGWSVFLGDFTPLNFFFDGLGTFFIVRGIIRMRKEKQNS